MYLGIDIGGTKTLVASFSDLGVLEQKIQFPTSRIYHDFLRDLANSVAGFTNRTWHAIGIAFPGRINHEQGIGIAGGNIAWKNIALRADLHKMLNAPVALENDAKLAGLSEARLLAKQYNRVLYVTVSTGIGTSVIVNQHIDPDFANTEGGQIILEHNGTLKKWEQFASGSAIVRQFGKRASEIHDPQTWQLIAKNIAVGLIDLCAIIQPEVIVLGGSVSSYFSRFKPELHQEMQLYATPLVPLPVVLKAQRPHEAVVYGCYELARELYARTH